MRLKAYLLVFDGLADWEPAHALCEINKSKKYDVITAGFSKGVVTSMGGIKMTPDIPLSGVNSSEAAIFIMPGGEMWHKNSQPELHRLLHRLNKKNVPIAAICAATLEVARAGLTGQTLHTSNAKKYLKAMVPDYRDDDFYVEKLAITDKNLITASGLGSLEFGREIIRKLKIHNEADTNMWFNMFKSGVIPPQWVP